MQPLLSLWCISYPSFSFINVFKTFYHSLPFLGCKRCSLCRVKADISFFYPWILFIPPPLDKFFLWFLFFTFFFLTPTGETFFVNPASGTMDITTPKDSPSHSLHTESNFLYISPYLFHFLCWFKIFQLAIWLDSNLCEWLPSARHTTCAFFEEVTLYW